jgi:hypothetical protein
MSPKFKTVLEYVSLVIAIPFATISFILGTIYGAVIAGWEISKEVL